MFAVVVVGVLVGGVFGVMLARSIDERCQRVLVAQPHLKRAGVNFESR
jgi:hypothetical protein